MIVKVQGGGGGTYANTGTSQTFGREAQRTCLLPVFGI